MIKNLWAWLNEKNTYFYDKDKFSTKDNDNKKSMVTQKWANDILDYLVF